MKTRKFYLRCLVFFALFPWAILFANNGIVKGIISDQKTYEILYDAKLTLYSNNVYFDVEWSDEEGVFTFENVDTGWFKLVVDCDDYQRKIFDSIRIDSNTLFLIYPSVKNIRGYYANYYQKGDFESRRFSQPNYIDLYNPFDGLKIYPNPVQDYLTIQRKTLSNVEVQISDMNGNRFDHFKLSELNQKVSVQHLPKGLYVIIFTCLDEQKEFRFLVQ
jgi:hypothetical protein